MAPREAAQERDHDHLIRSIAPPAAPATRRTRSTQLHVAPVAPNSRFTGKSAETTDSSKSERPSAISDLPANRSIPPLAPNRPKPPFPRFPTGSPKTVGSSFSAESAKPGEATGSRLSRRIAKTVDSQLYRQIAISPAATESPLPVNRNARRRSRIDRQTGRFPADRRSGPNRSSDPFRPTPPVGGADNCRVDKHRPNQVKTGQATVAGQGLS